MVKSIVFAFMILGFSVAVFEVCYILRSNKGAAEQKIVVKCFFAIGVVLFLFVGLPLTLYIVELIPRWLYWLMLGLFLVFTALADVWANKELKKVRKDNENYNP